jgi:hypothetical protein
MENFCPIVYSVPDGAAISETVEAADADQACRVAVSKRLGISSAEAERLFSAGQLEVIAVIKGSPGFALTAKSKLFPWV